jgi:HlyD family secretion protein
MKPPHENTDTPRPTRRACAGAETATAKPATADIQALLGTDQPARWWARPSLWIGLAVLAAAAGGIYYWQAQKESNAAPVYVTEALRKGNLTLTVAANGTLQPTRSVSIGSELSGTVRKRAGGCERQGQEGPGAGGAGHRQARRAGAALARLAGGRAGAAGADRRHHQRGARWAWRACEEVARLSGGKVPSATELDSGRATLDRAVADEASARASVADAPRRSPPMRPTCPRRRSARPSTAWC